MRIDKHATTALSTLFQEGERNRKALLEQGRKQHNELKKHVQEHSAASRAVTLAAHERSMEQHGERKQENARTHKQNEKTHEGINGLKGEVERLRIEAEEAAEGRKLAAEDRKLAAEDRKVAAEDRKRAEERENRVEALMTSLKKQPNPEPANQGALAPPRALFGTDAVPIADDASTLTSTLTSEDAEDADATVASLKQALKDEREKNRALTIPSGQVGLSEIPPSVTNQTGRARDAEAKHVGEKTKRRQQDEQTKTMRTKRYVPAPTRRSTRSTRSSSAKK